MVTDGPNVTALEQARCAAMTPYERVKIASSMFDTACALIDASLTTDLSHEERRCTYEYRTTIPAHHGKLCCC